MADQAAVAAGVVVAEAVPGLRAGEAARRRT